MAVSVASHPSREELASFLHGRLSHADQTRIERHVSGCDTCCRVMETLPEDTLVDRLRPDTPREDSKSATTSPAAFPKEFLGHARYRIIRLLGHGGMGVVYQAEHRIMERPVALKIIHRDLLHHPTALERFHQEVKSAARLQHPNIVTAFDADQVGETHFLVMEYVEGISLARYVEKKGPMSMELACHCIRQAAIGLQHAHGLGMVHRDIKPQNLMLTRKGQLKILDFGLARFAHPGATQDLVRPAPASRVGAGLTEAGTALGTPGYMAPEQSRDARDVDIRADIYSLGCTLYFLLTGTTPPAASETGVPDSALWPGHEGVPAELAMTLARMVAAHPEDRYQIPQDVARALTSFTRPAPPAVELPSDAGVAVKTEPKRRSPRARRVVGLCMAALVALTIFGVAGWHFDWFRANHGVVPPGNAAELPILVVVPEQFDPKSLAGIREALGPVRAYRIVSTDAECWPANKQGGAVAADLVLLRDRVEARDFAAIIVSAGYPWKFKEATSPYRPEMQRILRDAKAQGKPIGAIETGLRVLAYADLLRDMRCSSYPPIDSETPRHGAVWTNQPVERSFNIFSAGSVTHAAELTRRVLESLSKKP